VLDSLATTDVGGTVPPVEEDDEGHRFTTFSEDESEVSGMEDGTEAEEAWDRPGEGV